MYHVLGSSFEHDKPFSVSLGNIRYHFDWKMIYNTISGILLLDDWLIDTWPSVAHFLGTLLHIMLGLGEKPLNQNIFTAIWMQRLLKTTQTTQTCLIVEARDPSVYSRNCSIIGIPAFGRWASIFFARLHPCLFRYVFLI